MKYRNSNENTSELRLIADWINLRREHELWLRVGLIGILQKIQMISSLGGCSGSIHNLKDQLRATILLHFNAFVIISPQCTPKN